MPADSVFKDDILKGKVALITGGGTGIGFGIATSLGSHGAKIAIAARRQNVLDEACEKLARQGITAIGLTLDVRDPKSCENIVQQVVDKFGQIDILVNNAAGNFMTPIESLSFNGFKTVLDIDLMGTFNMAKAVLPFMKAKHDTDSAARSSIINITATLHYKAMPFQMHASAAKSAVDVLTNNIGVEWGEYGVQCVSVAPGPIADTVGGPTGRVFGQKGQKIDAAEMMMPGGKFGTVQDIANTVTFLVSPAGKFITSTAVVVDGGQWHDATRMYKMMKKTVQLKSEDEKKNFKGGVVKNESSKL